MRKVLYLLGICSIIFLSCETELTDFRVKNLSSAIVVFGELTNYSQPIRVRLNYTTSYSPYDITQFKGKGVRNAQVRVVDSKGTTINLIEQSDGLYSSLGNFTGKVSETYQLIIKTADGLEIKSSAEVLLPSPTISTYKATFVTAEKVENMKFNLTAAIGDNKQTEDYYFIKRQDFIEFLTTCPLPPPPPAPVPPCFSKCWQAPLNTQPILLKDFLINGQNIPINLGSIPAKDITDWVIDLEVYSIAKPTYQYWERQEEQRKIGGGLFDKVPAQIVGNLSCSNNDKQEVLGQFLVGGKTKKRLIIKRFEEFSKEEYEKVLKFTDYQDVRYKNLPLYDCQNAGFVDYNIGHKLPSF